MNILNVLSDIRLIYAALLVAVLIYMLLFYGSDPEC